MLSFVNLILPVECVPKNFVCDGVNGKHRITRIMNVIITEALVVYVAVVEESGGICRYVRRIDVCDVNIP